LGRESCPKGSMNNWLKDKNEAHLSLKENCP